MGVRCAISDVMQFERLSVAECGRAGRLRGVPAVYAWQLAPLSDPFDLTSAEKMCESVIRLAYSPVLTIGESIVAPKRGSERTVRSGLIEFERIRFGAKSPSTAELAELREFVSTPRGRIAISEYLSAAAEFAPVLYVGQTKNLRLRVRKHLAERSAFRTRVEACGLSVDDLALRFIELPRMTKRSRCFVERLLTHFCLAPLTVKAG
jgi:hypothetical protein